MLGNVTKKQNKLVEWKAFVDIVKIRSADWKNKFLFQSFAAVHASLTQGEAADRHMLFTMIGEI